MLGITFVCACLFIEAYSYDSTKQEGGSVLESAWKVVHKTERQTERLWKLVASHDAKRKKYELTSSVQDNIVTSKPNKDLDGEMRIIYDLITFANGWVSQLQDYLEILKLQVRSPSMSPEASPEASPETSLEESPGASPEASPEAELLLAGDGRL